MEIRARFVKTIIVCVVTLTGSSVWAGGAMESPGGGGGGVAMPMGGASNAANQASKKQDDAKQAAMMMAAMMAAMCNPQYNPVPCVLAPLCLAQAGSLDDTSQGAQQVGQMLASGGGAGGGTAPVDNTKFGTPGGGATASSIKKTLADKGVTVATDGSSVTMPDGSTLPVNANMATDSGGKSAGLNDAQIAAGKAALAQAQAKVGGSRFNTEGDETTGGGGGSRSSGSMAPLFKISGRTRAKTSLSGMTKNLGGDKIGVAADDIFDMISRRYKAKDAAETFLKN